MNQSSLKILLNNPSQFKNIIDGNVTSSNTDYFAFGTAVDTLITEGVAQYKKNFAIITKLPSETIKLIVEDVLNEVIVQDLIYQKDDLNYYTTLIESALNKYNYQAKWKLQTRVDKIIKEGNEYFTFLMHSKGKISISEYDSEQAMKCYMSIVSNKFYTELTSQGKIKYKEVVEFRIKGVDMKAELDAIVINEKEKFIIPIDYKTSGSNVLFFNSSFWKFRYDFQAAAYTEALKQKYPGYEIKPFRFVVVNKDYPSVPIVYKVDEHILEIGLNGGTLSNGKKLEGLNDSLDRYAWHMKHDLWQYPMEYYNNKSLNIII